MGKIELVYFDGCPNVERARQAIRDSGVIEFSEVHQNCLPKDSHYRSFSSPTILLDGNIIVGSQSGATACSMINWNELTVEIRARLVRDGH